jgi:mono/diheme cytochrome c family protein
MGEVLPRSGRAMKAKMVAVALAAMSMAASSGTAFADAAVGKATFVAQCTECHEAGDFEGTAAKDLNETLTHMAAGHVKHKKPIKLTTAEIADVAAYLSAGK